MPSSLHEGPVDMIPEPPSRAKRPAATRRGPNATVQQRRRQGVAPETLALNALRERFLAAAALQPRDEWERGLLAAARDCGVSLPNSAVSSEGLYD